MTEASVLRLRDRELRLEPGVPALMGIVNCTPDSFSDSASERRRGIDETVAAARRLVEDGAAIVDVGGESGVTHTAIVEADEEIARILPVVERLVADGALVSIDTWKPDVAEAALAAGAHVINDVSALYDPRLADVVAAHDAGLVVMHTRAEPKTEHFPDYGGDVVGDVRALLAELRDRALAAGVAPESLVVDPGPDFAKAPLETLATMRDLPALGALGHPVLLAISRKYFLGTIVGREPDQRLPATLAALAWCGAQVPFSIARVHDVRAAADHLRILGTLAGRLEAPDVARDVARLRILHDEDAPVGDEDEAADDLAASG